MVRWGLLAADPTGDDEIRVRVADRLDGAAFTPADVDPPGRHRPPPERVTSAWPARDAAIVSLLAHCGLRVSELCALAPTATDANGELPLVRMGPKAARPATSPSPGEPMFASTAIYVSAPPTATEPPLLGCSSAATVGEHYWRIGAYVDGDTVVDAVAPGVELLFIRRRLSRYVHLMG